MHLLKGRVVPSVVHQLSVLALAVANHFYGEAVDIFLVVFNGWLPSLLTTHGDGITGFFLQHVSAGDDHPDHTWTFVWSLGNPFKQTGGLPTVSVLQVHDVSA